MKWQPTPVFLPGESCGQRSLVGCCLWGLTESDTTEVTYQQQPESEPCVLRCFSHVWLFATLWTVRSQVPLSMGFPRQEHWSEFPYSPPADLPNPGIKTVSPVSSALQVDSSLLSHWGSLNLSLGHLKNISKSHIMAKKSQPSCFSFMQSSFIPIRNLPAILHVELNEVKNILNWSLWLRPCSLNRKKWQGSESSLK